MDEYVLVPPAWRKALGWARVALAAASIALEAAASPPSSGLIRVLLGLFLVFALLAVFWPRLRRAGFAGFSLILDSTYFLIAAMIRSPEGPWVCAAFLLYLLLQSVLFHAWRQVVGTGAFLTVVFFLVRPEDMDRLAPAFIVGGVLGVLLSFHREQIVERLVKTSRKAVLYRAEAQNARDGERARIAADFHDGPQQSFISMQMRLEILRKLLDRDPAAARRELAELQELGRAQVDEIRAFIRGMRPIEVGDSGLVGTLERLIGLFERDSGIATALSAGEDVEIENADVAREVIHIVREALHNAQKHSGASRVDVGLERTDGWLRLSVRDDGRGFSFSGTYTLEELDVLRVGPLSIKQRVRGLGGSLTLETGPGRGAGLEIRIPL
jgi:signal transduction histidine kinase